MSYDYNVPKVDLLDAFNEDDGADTFFDIDKRLEKQLTLEDPEEESFQATSVSTLKSSESLSPVHVSSSQKEKPKEIDIKEIKVLQEITGNVQNIMESKKRKSDHDNRSVKFISLAESIRGFPGHMRETSHLYTLKTTGKNGKSHLTIPQSPMLLSKSRTRPVNYPSAEEREQKEIEEIESFKLKANPINPKIFEPPRLGNRVPKAPVTVEPFNLTEIKIKKKETEASSPVFQFKAKPVPKEILEHPVGVPERKQLPTTTPQTPYFVQKYKIRFQTIEDVDGHLKIVDHSPSHMSVSIPKVCGKTTLCPFSFEERTKLMIKHKEDKIKKVLEEEKEARKFHAKPVPAFIKKKLKDSLVDSQSSSKMNRSNDQETQQMFKAQPADVLHKEPFKPKLPERSFISPDNVVLHTEVRAQSRREFDEQIKKRDEEIQEYLRRRKEAEEKREQEEIARLRQEAVHKAQPIRLYKPVPEKQRNVITSPITPKFTERFKK